MTTEPVTELEQRLLNRLTEVGAWDGLVVTMSADNEGDNIITVENEDLHKNVFVVSGPQPPSEF